MYTSIKIKISTKLIKKYIFIYIRYNYKVSSITRIVLLTQNRKCYAMTAVLTHIYIIEVV